MALELNGTTGVSLVQDGVVTAADLSSTLDLTGKTVTLPSGVGGKVLQVVQDIDVGGNSTSSTTYQSCGLSASITPSSTANKILILSNSVIDCNSGRQFAATIFKNGTDMAASVGNGNEGFIGAEDTGRSASSIMYLDSPSTTNATTYEIKFRSKNSTTVEFPPYGSITTTLILMEIA
jgi:hypothetical protein